jgi:hypothetical protein
MTEPYRMKAATPLMALVAAALVPSGPASARTEIGDFEISGEIFHMTELRWGRDSGPGQLGAAVAPGVFLGPGDLGAPSNSDQYATLNAFRTELSLEFVYRGIEHITPVLKLRPYYDGMFDINDKADGISKYWQTNMRSGVNNDWDPIVREAFVDFNYNPLFVRAGRQIVTWGRSDGVTVLDVVTPRNFRNPLTFEQERFMIPQWMVNSTLDLSSLEWLPGGIQKELQVIWNLDYLPSRFPGMRPMEEEGRHPYTLAVVEYANQVINVSNGLFGNDFFDRDKYDNGDAIDKSEVFVRWRARTGEGLGPLSDMTYSIHYAYLFEDIPFYELNNRINVGFAFDIAGPRGIGGGIDFNRRRYQLAGLSFDKALMWLPGQLQGTVLRGEMAYSFGNSFYEPDLALKEADNLTTLVGLDQYLYLTPRSWVETPWFVSFQYWRDQIMRKAGPGEFTRLDSVACGAQPLCGETGYIIGGASDFFNGLRDEKRDVFTLFMFNDFLTGKTLHVELFGLYEFRSRQESAWFRGVVGYNFDNHLTGRVGLNIIEGQKDAFFGQFKDNDHVFVELKYTF